MLNRPRSVTPDLPAAHRSGLVVCLVALLPAACWVPKETGVAMQRDIDNLDQAMQNARKAIDEQQAQLGEQMERADVQIKEVDKKLQDLNRAARSTDADFGVQMEEIRREMQELRGQVELINFRLGQLDGQLQGEGSLTERLEKLEKRLSRSDGTPPPTPVAAKGDMPRDSGGLLALARQFAKQGKVEDARGVFRQVIRKWPKKQGVADEAYFRLGELYAKEKKFRSALQEYIYVVERFPKGTWADDSYFGIGIASLELGSYEDAQIFFDEIVKNHKKSPLVKKAQAKLVEVQKRLAAEKKRPKKKKKGK